MSDDGQTGRPIATPSQTVGPFFHVGLTGDGEPGALAASGVEGERIRLRIRVLDGEGAAVPDAMVEIHQADAAGAYAQPPFRGFGRQPTDNEGACTFDTIRPGAVPDSAGGHQAAHVDVCLFARGLLRQVYTRICFAGDSAIETDPLIGLVPADRRHTLVAAPVPGEAATWEFVIRLQGEDETVFFDV